MKGKILFVHLSDITMANLKAFCSEHRLKLKSFVTVALEAIMEEPTVWLINYETFVDHFKEKPNSSATAVILEEKPAEPAEPEAPEPKITVETFDIEKTETPVRSSGPAESDYQKRQKR